MQTGTQAEPHILVDHRGFKGLGDVVCEMAWYPALRERYPGASIASRGGRSLVWGHPCVDAFDETSPDESFDRVVRVPHVGTVIDRLAQWEGPGDRIFDRFMGPVGLGLAQIPELYVLPSEMEELGLEDDGEDGLIVAYSIDSKEVDRRWGRDRFAALLSHLERTYGVSLIELGSGYSAGHLGLGLDMVGSTTLRQTMAVLSLADLFIGNHGGLTHLAGGVGTPILAPWGASAPYAAYAYDDLSVAVETDPTCRHCIWTRRMLPECRQADLLVGNTPCVQAITVEQMIAAAEGLLPRLQERRSELREQKAARRALARDPRRLARFEQARGVTPNSNLHLYLGGKAGWGASLSAGPVSSLKWLLAFPDWLDPTCPWEGLIDAFLARYDADSSWVLVLTAGSLSGAEAGDLLVRYLGLKPSPASWPKIMVIAGFLGADERQWLMEQATVLVTFEGSPEGHLPPGLAVVPIDRLSHWAG